MYRRLGRFRRRLVWARVCALVVIVRFVPKKVPKYLRLKWEQVQGESHSMARERSA